MRDANCEQGERECLVRSELSSKSALGMNGDPYDYGREDGQTYGVSSALRVEGENERARKRRRREPARYYSIEGTMVT